MNNIDELFKAAKNGDGEKAKKLGEEMKNSLSDEQKAKLEKALTDGDYLKSLLSSPKAAGIINELKKKGIG